jgi:hypothetical protein
MTGDILSGKLYSLGWTIVVGVCLLSQSLSAPASSAEPVTLVPREAYNWRNVAIGGGSYVTGIAIHPSEPNLVYVRTDIGGAYRFTAKPDPLGRNWVPLTDHFPWSKRNYFGIDSIAVDPNDPNVVYIAAGKWAWAGDGRILRSDDRGLSWKPLPLELPVVAAGEFRVTRERLAVDPNDSRRVYFGSRQSGLWLSEDRGEHWRQLKSLPAKPDKEAGIPFVIPDPFARPGKGKPAPVFAALYGVGIAFSQDGGKSWSLIGGPKQPFQGALARDGALYVTGPEGVHRFLDGNWSNVTPVARMEFAAVAVHPKDPSTLMVGEWKFAKYLSLYLSRDRGRHWKALSQASGSLSFQPNVPWWPRAYFPSATSAIAFDPHVSGRLWVTDWYGTYFTDSFDSRPVTFRTLERGHEEVVAMTLATPPKGAALLSGLHDVEGFRHEAIDTFPERSFPHIGFWNTFGIDYNEDDPDFIVRVGTKGPHVQKGNGGVVLSDDNGRTWKAVSWPFDAPMKVAYSARERDLFVVLPLKGAPKRTANAGKSWEDGVGVNGRAVTAYWHWNHPIAADRVRGRHFYLFVDGTFYRSEDGGLNWAKKATLPKSPQHYVESEPGNAGHVWVSLGQSGLFRSTNGGNAFTRIPTVKTAYLFGLGRPMRPSDIPAVYLYGVLAQGRGEEPGILRSDDLGVSWVAIDSPTQPITNEPTIMRGDRLNAGRVYVGTNGRGIFVGIPAR